MQTAIVVLLGIVVVLSLAIYYTTVRILNNLELTLENDDVD